MRRSIVALSLAALMLLIWPATGLAGGGPLPNMGTAGNYAVLASATVTNTGPSWITGQIGLSPGSSVVGLPPGGPGTSGHQDIANAAAVQAKIDLSTAYTNAAGAGPCTPAGPELGGLTLVAGVYCNDSGFMTLTGGPTPGPLTLNGGGLYIFQMASTLTTTSASSVVLENGAQPCDIFWQVGSSAIIGTSTTFVGNILANTSITMQTRATLNGRALAGAGPGTGLTTGAVTLDTNRIIQAAGCGYSAPLFVAGPSGTTLPATLAPFSPITPLPGNTGVPLELRGEFPWLLLIGVGAGLGATAMGISRRRRRRRNA